MAEYASNAKANAALTTGIIGTSLGALASAGGVAGVLGFQPRGNQPPPDPGERAVTRYEMEQIKENFDLKTENALLKAQKYADEKAEGLQRQIGALDKHDAVLDGAVGSISQQVQQLFGLTRLYVPNQNLAPGYGPAIVMPGFPPPPPANTTTGGTATTTGNTGT